MMILYNAAMIQDRYLIDVLRNEHFDLAMTEMYEYCGFGLFHMINIRAHIILSAVDITFAHMDLIGLPNVIAYVPSQFT